MPNYSPWVRASSRDSRNKKRWQTRIQQTQGNNWFCFHYLAFLNSQKIQIPAHQSVPLFHTFEFCLEEPDTESARALVADDYVEKREVPSPAGATTHYLIRLRSRTYPTDESPQYLRQDLTRRANLIRNVINHFSRQNGGALPPEYKQHCEKLIDESVSLSGLIALQLRLINENNAYSSCRRVIEKQKRKKKPAKSDPLTRLQPHFIPLYSVAECLLELQRCVVEKPQSTALKPKHMKMLMTMRKLRYRYQDGSGDEQDSTQEVFEEVDLTYLKYAFALYPQEIAACVPFDINIGRKPPPATPTDVFTRQPNSTVQAGANTGQITRRIVRQPKEGTNQPSHAPVAHPDSPAQPDSAAQNASRQPGPDAYDKPTSAHGQPAAYPTGKTASIHGHRAKLSPHKAIQSDGEQPSPPYPTAITVGCANT